MLSGRNKSGRNRGIVIIVAVMVIGSLLIWWQPWQGFGYPPGVGQPENSATVFQAFYITYESGKSDWIYPPERAVALSVIGVDEVNEAITKVQTHVFMNVNYDTSKSLSSWTFSTVASFELLELNGENLFGRYDQKIEATGTKLEENKDTWLTSASMSATDIEQLVSFQSGNQYKFVVKLRDIKIALNFSDGSFAEMYALGGASNDLEWRFIYV